MKNDICLCLVALCPECVAADRAEKRMFFFFFDTFGHCYVWLQLKIVSHILYSNHFDNALINCRNQKIVADKIPPRKDGVYKFVLFCQTTRPTVRKI